MLREIETADTAAIREMRSNQAVNRYITRPAIVEVAAAKALVEKSRLTDLAWGAV